jgi:hypothetical protein
VYVVEGRVDVMYPEEQARKRNLIYWGGETYSS